MNMKSIKVRAWSPRAEWEVLEPLFYRWGLAVVVIVGALSFSGGWMAGLRAAAAAAVGVGAALIVIHRASMLHYAQMLGTDKTEKGYDIDVPALAYRLYEDAEAELSFQRGEAFKSTLFVAGIAFLFFLDGNPGWFLLAGAVLTGFAFFAAGPKGLALLSLVLVVPLGIGAELVANAHGASAGSKGTLATWMMFIFAVILSGPGLAIFHRSSDDEGEAHFPFSVPSNESWLKLIHKRSIVRHAARYKEFAEIRGFPAESDTPEAGTVHRGQKADSDAVADALSRME